MENENRPDSRNVGLSAGLEHDPVNHPKHYTSHPSGVECIVVAEHMNFCLGNAMKYIWRAGEKGDALEDLRKARWYIDREIERRANDQGKQLAERREDSLLDPAVGRQRDNA